MDIRPVDVQMFINKSSSTNRLENNDQRQLDQNMLFSEQMKKNVNEENSKTVSSNKSEDSHINKDGKQGGKNNQKNKNAKQKKDEKAKKNKASMSFLDISI